MRIRRDCIDDYFNYKLREARVDSGFSEKELAEKVGVSFCTVCAYERLRCFPSRDVAARIAELLEKEVGEIFPDNLREVIYEIRKERKEIRKQKKRKEIRKQEETHKRGKEILYGLMQGQKYEPVDN